MGLPRITSHPHELWLGISSIVLFGSLDPHFFHKCFQQISKPTSASHTHPTVMISTAHCLRTRRNICFRLFRASSLHLTPLELVWRAWTVTFHLPYSGLYQCLSHSRLIIPLAQWRALTVHPFLTLKLFSLSLIIIFAACEPLPVLLHPLKTGDKTFKTQQATDVHSNTMTFLFSPPLLLNKPISAVNIHESWAAVSLGLSSEGMGKGVWRMYEEIS